MCTPWWPLSFLVLQITFSGFMVTFWVYVAKIDPNGYTMIHPFQRPQAEFTMGPPHDVEGNFLSKTHFLASTPWWKIAISLKENYLPVKGRVFNVPFRMGWRMGSPIPFQNWHDKSWSWRFQHLMTCGNLEPRNRTFACNVCLQLATISLCSPAFTPFQTLVGTKRPFFPQHHRDTLW